MQTVFKRVYLEPYHENEIMIDTSAINTAEYYDREFLNGMTKGEIPSDIKGLLQLKVVDNAMQPDYLFVHGTLSGFFELQKHAEKYDNGIVGSQNDLVYYPEQIGGRV